MVINYKDNPVCQLHTYNLYKNTTNRQRKVVFIFECETLFKPDFFMIPAVSYN